MSNLLDYILHIDVYLISFVTTYGLWAYALLFLIIFCETGLVIIPFLPGDSLLFAAGSISAYEALDIKLLFVLLLSAAIIGNKINYLIGKAVGPRIFSLQKNQISGIWSILFNQDHLTAAHHFYARHGGKTIILARFIPIVRTFAPFVAGAANMRLSLFTFYNIISGFLWVSSLLAAGYYFGNLPFIKQHLSLVIYAMIAVSLLPPTLGFLYRQYTLKITRSC